MKKSFVVAVIGFLLDLLAISMPANAAPTTTTINPCNRSDVKINTPITVKDNDANVSFFVLNSCHFNIGLASYESPSTKYDPNTVSQEIPFAHSQESFGDDGQVHTLDIPVPNCYYEVDLFLWNYIPHFTKTNQYLGDLVRSVNAGTQSCSSHNTTTTFAQPGGGTPPNTTLPKVIKSTAKSTVAHEKTLALTGIAVKPFVILGTALLGVGFVIELIRKRRQGAMHIWQHLRVE